MTKFKQFLFWLAFQENGFNFVYQQYAKNWKMPFWKAQKIVFDLKVASKLFPKKLPMTKFEFKWQ